MNQVTEGQTLYTLNYARMEEIVVDKVTPKRIKSGRRTLQRTDRENVVAHAFVEDWFASPDEALAWEVGKLRARAAQMTAEADALVAKYGGAS